MRLDTTRYEARQRVRGSLALAALLGTFALLVIFLFPSIAESSADIEALIQSYPESVREGFGVESYATIEGFVAGEVYQFLWVLLFGLYLAYTAGGAVASDVESKRLYLVLATPVSRAQLVFEKTLGLLTPVVVLNLVLPMVVFGGSVAVDHPLDPVWLLAVHLLTTPYLLVCTGIGLLLSVSVDRAGTAQVAGIAVVFLLFVLDSVTAGTDVDWLGAVSPTRYVDVTDVLLHETVAIGDALLLLAVALALVLASAARFQSRDV